MIAIDTNLLVYAHRTGTPQHLSARRMIEQVSLAPGGWGFPVGCVSEFWSVVTNSRMEGGPSTPIQITKFFAGLTAGGAQIFYPRDGFGDRLMRVAADLDVRGRRIFDLQLAIAAFEGGASEIWTNDRDFITVPGLRAVHPFGRTH